MGSSPSLRHRHSSNGGTNELSRDPSSDTVAAYNLDLELASPERLPLRQRSLRSKRSRPSEIEDESVRKSKKKKSHANEKKQPKKSPVDDELSHSESDADTPTIQQGSERARRSHYPKETRKLIDVTALDLAARLLTSDPFADEDTTIAEAKRAWERTMRTYNKKVPMGGSILQIVSDINLKCYVY